MSVTVVFILAPAKQASVLAVWGEPIRVVNHSVMTVKSQEFCGTLTEDPALCS